MAFLRAKDWRLGDELVRNVQDKSWGGFMVYEIIERAMRLLRKHIEDGSIYGFARELSEEFDTEGSVDVACRYTPADLERLLKRGEFNYNRTIDLGYQVESGEQLSEPVGEQLAGSPVDFHSGVTTYTSSELEILDICPPCEPHAGASTTEELWVELNWQEFLARAEHPQFCDLYPKDRLGMNRVAIDMAAVLLHQIMHNQQFQHPDNPGRSFEYDPEEPYYRSLPNVAQQAVYLVADGYYEGSGDKPSASERWPSTCGCVRKTVAPKPLPNVPGAAVSPAVRDLYRPGRS